MPPAIALPHESKIYSRFAHFYDRIFTSFFEERIERVLADLDIRPGASVLEVGVGTGLSLAAYPVHCQVTGIDLAPDMLERAQRKVHENGWRHIDLAVGNAQALDFPDESFDYVTTFHVVSVVPDPGKMMREMVRVCRPGGTIVIINHFRSERRWLAWAIDKLDPLTRKLGWRTTLKVSDLLGEAPLELVRRYKTSSRSLFTVMIARKPLAASIPTRAAR
jgi:phosphatidylethanolamine/phosphatidyl-N-methylethanolamine N-methyltransferase